MEKNGGQALDQLSVDVDNLYREETYTDLKAATIRRVSPVTRDGSPDLKRAPLFLGQTQVVTAAGVLPLDFEIEAKTLEEACRAFPSAAKSAVEEMVAQARALQREQASRLIVPGAADLPPKIQLR